MNIATPTSDSGMAMTGMSVERMLPRKRKITITTMMAASASVFVTSSIEALMNSVASKAILASSPSGSCRSISGIALRTASMTLSGLASGVAWMPRNTALRPSKAEVESKVWGPRSTVAIWPRRMTVSPRVATTSCSKAAGVSSEVWALMFCCVKSPFTWPAAVVKLFCASAFETSSGVMPSEAILSGLSQTRMAKVAPPRISASATPEMAWICGFTTRSR